MAVARKRVIEELIGEFETGSPEPEKSKPRKRPETKFQDPLEVITTDQFADLVGLTARRVQVLTREGVLNTVSQGRYNRRDSIQAYCEDLRRKTSGRNSSTPELAAEKLRLTKMQADKAEMQNQLARRELLSAIEVEREWASILRHVRSGLLALPSRVQQRLGHLTTHDISTLDREIRNTLEEISNGDR